MNPLDFRGPQFLSFFFFWSLGVIALAWLARSFWERNAPPPSPRWTPGVYPGEGDAYAIALLRGGPGEAALTMLGRLAAEGYVSVDGRQLKLSETPPSGPSLLAPIEEETLHAVFPEAGVAVEAPEAQRRAGAAMARHIAGLAGDLEQQGLALAEPQRKVYDRFLGIALAAILGLGGLKVLVGLARGRSVGYLLFCLAAFSALAWLVLRRPRQTPAGQRYLAWLWQSHLGLTRMIAQEKRTGYGELALAAGIYGLDALPVFSPLTTALRPPPGQGGDASCGGGDGGGGGGCGGGCGGGGCGGCGS